MRNAKIHEKSDERILGNGDFVSRVLSKSNKTLERQTALKVRGVDIDYIMAKVAGIMHMSEDDIWMPGRTNNLVRAWLGLFIFSPCLISQININISCYNKKGESVHNRNPLIL
ncbi:MAG: hypothetical protein K9L30_06995 [Desulfobacterales bacterium]|nr:hypothetical protein [Desulfobacterales bacterium]